jgi:DNA polymerase-3 subunit epsilon
MFDWIKNINKEYPDFWKNYISKFETKSNRYIILKTERTGTNPNKDVILSIGAVAVINDNIVLNDSFEAVLLQYVYMHDHGLSNDYIIESKQAKLGEYDAIKSFVEFIGNSILVGYRTNLDVNMINYVLEKMDCGKLKNQAIDIEIMHQKLVDNTTKSYSIDDICKTQKINKLESQTTSEDAYTIALTFLKLKSKLGLK